MLPAWLWKMNVFVRCLCVCSIRRFLCLCLWLSWRNKCLSVFVVARSWCISCTWVSKEWPNKNVREWKFPAYKKNQENNKNVSLLLTFNGQRYFNDGRPGNKKHCHGHEFTTKNDEIFIDRLENLVISYLYFEFLSCFI